MSAAWIVVVAVGALSIASKSAGPVLIGRRTLPPLALRLVELLAPVMLAALVIVQAVGGDREIVLDARLAGLGAAGIFPLVQGRAAGDDGRRRGRGRARPPARLRGSPDGRGGDCRTGLAGP